MKKKRAAQSAFMQSACCPHGAYLRRRMFSVNGNFAGLLLAPNHRAKPSQRTLTFAERVAYQRAIEEVYWRHRIWPKESPDPKPSLDAVISQAQLEEKVEDYLRESQALEDYWQRPITAEQLQAEMDRMAQHTKQPDVLRELFEALGNDPFVIAECLARPVLVGRLSSDFSGQDETRVFQIFRHRRRVEYVDSSNARKRRPIICQQFLKGILHALITRGQLPASPTRRFGETVRAQSGPAVK